MFSLSSYRYLIKRLGLSYRNKILAAVLVGAYLPAIMSFVYIARFEIAPDLRMRMFASVCVAALLGAALICLFLLHLLRPIDAASRSLRRYVSDGTLPKLSNDASSDEGGQLLSDTHNAIHHMHRMLQQMTDFDQVTGLPNRKAFQRELTWDMAGKRRFALCAMSLSNYDMIASAFGQEAIDTTCRHVAARFLEVLGASVRIARVGAKTFLFELDLAGGDYLATRIEEIRLSMQKELSLPAYNVYPELNAGVSIFDGQKIDAETLINEAISAMADTDIKVQGTNYNFATRNALKMERDLRMAVELNQLSLHYQPIVNLATGRVVGAEALVRWTHPERGPVSPALFIPIAEKSGLIDVIGLWILGETCRQLDLWSVTPLAGIKVSMNLSVRQFLRPNAVQLILEGLSNYSLNSRLLEVELTETTMIENRDRTLDALEQFRNLGITTAIDDFGAGFSSLSYLKTMPFDRIKIDRDFIRDVDRSSKSSAICMSLIELARGLKIEVLAEGTETVAEVETMRELGCTLFQGYYFARPVPPEQFAEAVRAAEEKLEELRVPFAVIPDPPASALVN